MANLEKDIAEQILRSEGLSAARLGLRFDRVVARVLGQLRTFAEVGVADGSAVLVTITAPILAPAKTIEALKEVIKDLAAASGPVAERSVTVHGNAVRLRLVATATGRNSKLIGFVHNPDANPGQLLQLAERWLRAG